MGGSTPLTQLGRYEIVRTLGHGAMGVVYEGRDPKLDRRVAIKTILKGHLIDSTLAADYSARFVREAQAVARLAHSNIVTVFDFGEQDEIAYLVMEFIRGGELAAHFDAGDFLDLPRGVRVMIELLDALAYAHERGIVHRDVKPANVMIDGSGHVKLTDFGVARLVDSNAERTIAGTMVGTPSYMSPEQIQGLAVGSRTDLFAAGVILYQFLTHRRPFTGGGSFSIQKMIVHDHPPPPSGVNPAVPAEFDTIVERALAKDPADRYASATAFADELRQALRLLPGGEATVPPLTAAPTAQAAAVLAATLPIDPDATVVQPTSAPRRPGTGTFARTLPAPALPSTALPSPALPSPALPSPPAAQPAPPASSRRMVVGAALGGVVVVGALVFALSRPSPAPAPAGAAVSAPPASAPAPAAAAAVVVPAPAVAPPAAVAAEPAPAAPAAAAAASPAERSVVPPAVRAAPATRTARDEVRKPAAPAAVDAPVPATNDAAARAASIRASASRCSDLLQRVQLGDTLSPSDLEVFQKECKR